MSTGAPHHAEPEPAPDWDERFEAVLRRYCTRADPAAPIDPHAPLAAQGLDSLDLVGIVYDVEETFGVEIPATLLGAPPGPSAADLWREVVRTLRPA
ncbi:acyl carrier protein [Jidongwangia harbinensis]|uniref:acyl carrier protein n=1 Tax=Jidongwangia harbinensis TaxID=2878561 RepID=UPI001CDA265D|nr:acyl carrier protein [Jidongwangia harbinensis]MCA2211333.1 acyl carrier protein [Jidongwangia harbinensis]